MLKVTEVEDGLVTLDASGKLTRMDTEVLFPVLEHLIHEHGTIRVLVRLHDFQGWEHSALQSDLEFSIRHLGKFERLAVVGGIDAGSVSSKLTQPLFAKRIRVFEQGQLAAARRWLHGSSPF